MIRRILNIFRGIFLVLVTLYGLLVLLLHIPAVQLQLTAFVEERLGSLLDTRVNVGRIGFNYPNRLVLDDVEIEDRTGVPMFEATRLAAKFDWLPLLKEQRISVHTAQVFGFHIHLYRPSQEAPVNFQFLIDALASEDTQKEKKPLDLRINSIVVRRGEICYDVLSEPKTPGEFNPGHIAVKNFNATFSLKSLRNDSVNATVKRMDFEEQCGFRLSSMQLKLQSGWERTVLSDFELGLPHSHLWIDSLVATYPIVTDSISSRRKFGVEGHIRRDSYLVPSDLSAFLPALAHFDDRLKIAAAFKQQGGNVGLSYLRLRSLGNEMNLDLDNAVVLFKRGEVPQVNAGLNELSIDTAGMAMLERNLRIKLPTPMLNAGFLRFAGEVKGKTDNLTAIGLLESGAGNVETNATLRLKPQQGMQYTGNIRSERIDLRQLFGEESRLGDVSFALDFSGHRQPEKGQSVYLQGTIPTLQYSGYEYQHIRMDGTFDTKGFNGLLALEDPNISFSVDGELNVADKTPTFNLTARLDHFRPHDLKLTEDRKGCEYGLKLRARFSGDNPDNLDGYLDVDSLTAIVPNDYFYLENLHVSAQGIGDGRKRLTVDSDFITALIEGKYAYRTLPAGFVRVIERYLPSLMKQGGQPKQTAGQVVTDNNFVFDLKLTDSNFYPYVLGIPLELHSSATVRGFVDDHRGRMQLEAYTPGFIYGESEFESGFVRCGNTESDMTASAGISKYMSGNSRTTFSLQARAAEDSLSTRLSWGNDTEVTYCGKVNAETHFSRAYPGSPYLKADVRVKPSEIILNDTVWNLRESAIRLDSGMVEINNFKVEHGDQHLSVDGRLTPYSRDSLLVDLNRIKVEYILDIVRFRSVRFTGEATGRVFVSGALGELKADTRLQVDNFHFNGGLMGDMQVSGRWDNELGVVLDADIREKGGLSRTTVKGNVSPIVDGLDLQIGAEGTSLAFLNSFVGGIFSDVQGRVNGNIHLHGPFKALNLEGDAVADATAHVKVLNTRFRLPNDSVRLRREYIEFPNVPIQDMEGHQGTLSGRLTHKNLGNMGYNFRFNLDNMLFYDTKDFGEMPFYGSIYGTGSALLWGGGNELHLNADIRTGRNTLFIYNMSSPESITDNRFITFVDKTPRPTVSNEHLALFNRKEGKKKEEEDGDPLRVSIDAAVEATSDATVRVIMDSRSGDYVATHGGGTININYTNEGADLRGTYTVERGVYKLSMQDVIRKDLQIQQGSEVTFSGDGGDADLNLKAVYTVNSASLSDLVPDATFNQNTVKVNCIINMMGKLASPVLDFDLELPTVNDEERQLVRSAISTDEQMRMQIIYLLGIGKFYTYDYANTEGRTSSDAMSSLLSSTLSGQLNNILSQALNMSNWNFSSNLSTGQEGWSDLEVEGILSGSLLNNRLLINGNFGYRENQLANSNFVGDFNLQWLLTPSGEIRLKAYNQTNDRYFAKTTFNTQGVGIIYKRDFDNWRSFFKRNGKKKKQRESEGK